MRTKITSLSFIFGILAIFQLHAMEEESIEEESKQTVPILVRFSPFTVNVFKIKEKNDPTRAENDPMPMQMFIDIIPGVTTAGEVIKKVIAIQPGRRIDYTLETEDIEDAYGDNLLSLWTISTVDDMPLNKIPNNKPIDIGYKQDAYDRDFFIRYTGSSPREPQVTIYFSPTTKANLNINENLIRIRITPGRDTAETILKKVTDQIGKQQEISKLSLWQKYRSGRLIRIKNQKIIDRDTLAVSGNQFSVEYVEYNVLSIEFPSETRNALHIENKSITVLYTPGTTTVKDVLKEVAAKLKIPYSDSLALWTINKDTKEPIDDLLPDGKIEDSYGPYAKRRAFYFYYD